MELKAAAKPVGRRLEVLRSYRIRKNAFAYTFEPKISDYSLTVYVLLPKRVSVTVVPIIYSNNLNIESVL